MSKVANFPKWSDLPLDPSHPPHSAWFVWGKDDELGTLNHLTPEVVLEAIKEVKTGIRVSIDWPLTTPAVPFLNRCKTEHQIIHKAPRTVNDDVITFNTQASSQWDSFRHYAYQDEKRFYNNVSMESVKGEKATTRNGIQAFSNAGIAGRGVLVDFYEYATANGKGYDPLSGRPITLDELKECAKAQKVEIRPGDIVLVRTGTVYAIQQLSAQAQVELAAKHPVPAAGVKQGDDILEWIWDSKLAAVGSDTVAWECLPPVTGELMHPLILSGLGCPLGELFDLEKLSAECKKAGRYSFFMTSAPLNVPGGVASPPNALCFL